MLVVDTNVFVYAVGNADPLRGRAQILVEAVERGDVRVTTTPEGVQEFLHLRASRGERPAAVDQAHDVMQMCSPLLEANGADVEHALALFSQHRRLDAFDCLLAAAAMRSDATGLVSADRGFREVPGLHWIDLATLDVSMLTE